MRPSWVRTSSEGLIAFGGTLKSSVKQWRDIGALSPSPMAVEIA